MQTKQRELFTTIKTEGSILPVDILQRISDGKADGMNPEDYHLYGEKLNEAISHSWNKLLGAWSAFKAVLAKLPESDTATTVTRERWLLPLFQELGYGRLAISKATEIDNKSYAISHMWHNAPIHLIGCRLDLDKRAQGVAGASRTSPHSLVQEFLNRSKEHLWAFVSNGYKLRILRDNVTLTRQAFVEFDIQSMMEGEIYSDFVILWLLCHFSRVEAEKPEQFWLEKWSKSSQQQGTRVLEQLRNGVEEAITALGKGFISYQANKALREKLRSGKLSSQDFYRQILRMVYRLIFLFVAEDRNLLLIPDAEQSAKDMYLKYYSTSRLRKLSESRKGTQHIDLWRGLSILFNKLGDENGCPELGLPALGSYLWSEKAIADLTPTEELNTDISNSFLLQAIYALSFTIDKNVRRSVDYVNLGSEELGSIYEALLELHPEINLEAGDFKLNTAAGNDRKTTGSYYTPGSLINCLLDSALEPVLDEAVKKENPENAILNLKICDPACGSGHFLVAASHRIAKRLAMVRTGEPEPSPEPVRKALRDVIGRCIYGVDINPMSVELCKVSLWMEAIEPGKPLSFLDHHIRCGNSLIGTTPALIANGIPDAAFNPIEGDDKAFCAEYKKKNKEQKKGQQSLFAPDLEPWEQLGNFASGMMNLNDIDDNTISGINKRQKKYEELVNSSGYLFGNLLADAWCAAFVWKKVKTDDLPYPITEDIFKKMENNPHSVPLWMKEEIQRLASQYQFFHYHLAFPDVFSLSVNGEKAENELTGWNGGFDVVLGNPPWERVKLQEKEWFAARDPEIANAGNASVRKKKIESLKENNPALYKAFNEAIRQAEGESSFVRTSGKYPLCGRGDVNTYAIFTELNKIVINPFGRVGCIVPSGIATDDTTKFFFQDIMDNASLVSLFDFENRNAIFQGVHRSFKFCLINLVGSKNKRKNESDFVFFALNIEDLLVEDKHFSLTAEEIKLLNPNARTCPIFRSKKDAELTKKIYKNIPALLKHNDSSEISWEPKYLRFVHYGDHSELLRDGINTKVLIEKNIDLYPVWESKLFHQFNHRYATYDDMNETKDSNLLELQNKNYFIKTKFSIEKDFFHKLIDKPRYDRNWYLLYRDITNSTNERTLICTAIPKTASTVSCPSLAYNENFKGSLLISNFNSFIVDYISRQLIGGLHMTFSILSQLAILSPETYEQICLWSKNHQLKGWILSRVLELTYTAWDLQDFAKDCDYDGPPFKWDEERRFLLRCELDAAYFHLYGIKREDVDYIMDTFPIVKKKDEQKYEKYRTKRVILEIYDAMAESIKTGQDYQTLLNPPPADSSVAHNSKELMELA